MFNFQELRIKPCPVVFVAFSGASKACLYKVFQVNYVNYLVLVLYVWRVLMIDYVVYSLNASFSCLPPVLVSADYSWSM